MVPKFLDARTKDGKLRLNAYSDKVSDLVKDFQNWIKDNNIPERMLWYADVFECESLKHFCSMKLSGESVIVNPAPEDSRLYPFGRKRPLRYLLHLY